MRPLQLLGTSSCHLCEQAEAALAELLAAGAPWEIELIDIADDDALVECYGERIPVLLDLVSGRDLGWPFDAALVLDFLDAGVQ